MRHRIVVSLLTDPHARSIMAQTERVSPAWLGTTESRTGAERGRTAAVDGEVPCSCSAGQRWTKKAKKVKRIACNPGNYRFGGCCSTKLRIGNSVGKALSGDCVNFEFRTRNRNYIDFFYSAAFLKPSRGCGEKKCHVGQWRWGHIWGQLAFMATADAYKY